MKKQERGETLLARRMRRMRTNDEIICVETITAKKHVSMSGPREMCALRSSLAKGSLTAVRKLAVKDLYRLG